MNKTKRVIRPHKGGRTRAATMLFTPAELDEIDDQRGDKSRADYFTECVSMRMELDRIKAELRELATMWESPEHDDKLFIGKIHSRQIKKLLKGGE